MSNLDDEKKIRHGENYKHGTKCRNIRDTAIMLLIRVARAAHHAMDNSEECPDDKCLMFPPWSTDLDDALTALEELPDNQPGVVMGSGAAKAEYILSGKAAAPTERADTPTPRTDAEEKYSEQIYQMLYPSSKVKPVRSKLARELERELAAANADLKVAQEAYITMAARWNSTNAEIAKLRDEAERGNWLIAQLHAMVDTSRGYRQGQTCWQFGDSVNRLFGDTPDAAIDAARKETK